MIFMIGLEKGSDVFLLIVRETIMVYVRIFEYLWRIFAGENEI